MSPEGEAARADRERRAYDEGAVDAAMQRWHGRFPHVFACPNTVRHEAIFEEETRQAVVARRVLEVGCGPGHHAARLLQLGARHVRAIDVSAHEVAKARERYELPGRLEFAVADATEGIEGRFDAIFGRSILHHIDYRRFLTQAYAGSLERGGTMLFMEPLGSNVLIRLYTALVAAAHTEDERSLMPEDLDWLRTSFPHVEIRPINYISLPLAIASSLVWPSPDNAVLRWADRVDAALELRPRIAPRFRQAAIVIRKPG
jgi:SAM-dependent methyltransferase